MTKKKKEKVDEEVKEEDTPKEEPKKTTNAKRDVKFRPTEWARQKGLDPHLFLHWENQVMNEDEFNKLKEERGA